MSRHRRSWFGQFTLVSHVHRSDSYYLTGRLSGTGERDGRTVELHVSRERLQSLVVNLTAEGDLFPQDHADIGSQVNRLRLLTHLGVPERIAREITGTTDHGPVTESLAAARANLH